MTSNTLLGCSILLGENNLSQCSPNELEQEPCHLGKWTEQGRYVFVFIEMLEVNFQVKEDVARKL